MTEYALEGPQWSSTTVTWSFAPGGGGFSGAIGTAYQSTIEAAINRWAQATGITFQQVTDSSSTDVRIGWGIFAPGGEIGQTNYSYRLGGHETFIPGTTVTLEDPSADALSPAAGATYAGTSTTLYQVVLHELGHSLGLAHSTDPNAVMYPILGQDNRDLSAADIAGVTSLYSTTGVALAQASTPPTPVTPVQVNLSDDSIAVYRFFDTHSGTQFLTADAAERNAVVLSRPDLTYEGLAMGAISPTAGDADAVPVYRFFDTSNGSHFFTASASEERQILATRHDLVPEQTSFYEHSTQQDGDTPVFRFFNTTNGTHFFTNSTAERAALITSRPDLVNEGVAFYAPST